MSAEYEVVADLKDRVPIDNIIPLQGGLSKKQQYMIMLNNSKRVVFPGVVRMIFQNYVLFVEINTGEIYRFNADLYESLYKENKIILTRKNTGEHRVVYENGVFYPTKGEFLLNSYKRSGGRRSLLFKCNEGGHFIPRVHQIIAMLGYGSLALSALGSGRPVVPNHIDGEKENNGIGNINITTQKGNHDHHKLFIRPKYRNGFNYVELFRKKWSETTGGQANANLQP